MQRLHGVAVLVLRMHAFDGEPAADVIPAKRRVKHEYVLSMFHHCVVDADACERFVFAPKRTIPGRRAPGGSDAQNGRVKSRLLLGEGRQDSASLPCKDAAVPVVLARSNVLPRKITLWFLAKPANVVDCDTLACCQWLAAMDVAVAGGREGRWNADGYQCCGIFIRQLRRDADGSTELLRRLDHVVRGRHDHRGVRIAPGDQGARKSTRL